jgi:hypothetical protein
MKTVDVLRASDEREVFQLTQQEKAEVRLAYIFGESAVDIKEWQFLDMCALFHDLINGNEPGTTSGRCIDTPQKRNKSQDRYIRAARAFVACGMISVDTSHAR